MFTERKGTVGARQGFTMIELLIVVAIIGLLAAIATPIFLGQRTKAYMKEAETNLQMIYTLEQEAYAEYGIFAPYNGTSFGLNGAVSEGTLVQYKGFSAVANDKDSLENYLRNLKLGDQSKLNFAYYAISNLSGQEFYAVARARDSAPGSIAKREVRLDFNGKWTYGQHAVSVP